MKKKSKILVPTDFSKSSENALRYAILMADKIDAEIILLNVIYPDVAVIDIPVTVDIAINEKIKSAEPQLVAQTERVMAQVTRQIKNIPIIESEIEIGIPDGVISKCASDHEVDFIFVGTRDQHGTMDKVFGSVASNVMRNAACPVLVIPEHADFQETTLVAYATDLNEIDPYEIWKTSKLLAPFNPIIRCVHFFEDDENDNTAIDMNELESFFSENAPALQITFHNIKVKNNVEGLMEFIDTYDINLLVMYRPRRSFFEKIRHPSFTKKMALRTKVPLLVLKKK